MTDAIQRLRNLIAAGQDRLRANVPGNRATAIASLVAAIDRGPETSLGGPDLIFGSRLTTPGGNLALQLCLESTPGGERIEGDLDAWSDRMLAACDRLSEAEMVLAHCESGFMGLADGTGGDVDAWIATSRPPSRWVERADFDWWGKWLAKAHGSGGKEQRDKQIVPGGDNPELRTARRRIAAMAHQLTLPEDAVIGGRSIRENLDVLAWLITQATTSGDPGEAAAVRSERELVAALASTFGLDHDLAAAMLDAFTLNREGAPLHAAVPGIAAAPLVRVGPDAVILSTRGLTAEPLLFLARELRRRDATAYHNVAHLREAVFRQDLYGLFRDRRFVTSPGRIELRGAAGNIRTDIDAAIFDRKSGALAIFELKSQDPFPRSNEELARHLDNFRQAGRQVSGVLDWINRNGADEILKRIDRRTAKTFRVQRVLPFVLGRYAAYLDQGRGVDGRMAWGSWPQALRLLDGAAFGSNPLATLATRLANDRPVLAAGDMAPQVVEVGSARITVYPSHSAIRDNIR